MSQLKITVNKEYSLTITKPNALEFDAVEIGPDKYHVIDQHKGYTAKIIAADFESKTYEVEVNHEKFSLQINDELDQLITEMGFEVGRGKKTNELKAPMPGLILELSVEVGQTVEENDPLLILEAMKMENVLASPRDGVIAAIEVQKGAAVEKNQLLIRFE